ncbi:MAG: ATP-dependent DNA helicase, partial [Candidatus Peregrinibacteria bacterium]
MAKVIKKTAAKPMKVKIESKAPFQASVLNARQREAVEHKNGPLLVIAGAGTGKTRVITERLAHIVNSGWCKNEQVLALTFTEKATAEIEERVDRLMRLGYESIPIHTFHGFCDQLLREFGMDIGIASNFKILQGVDRWMFMKEHLFTFELDYYRPMGNPTSFIDALLSTFSRFKEELNSPQAILKLAQEGMAIAQLPEDRLEVARLIELARAYEKYQALLAENGFLDFTDLHYKVIELFEKRPNILRHLQERYRYILVDEYQDTNIAQNRIVDQLAVEHQNLMVVGDDDQSIYKFRGAAISNILQFSEHYPQAKKIVLVENYRSDQRILDLAYASIQHNNPDRLEVRSKIDKKLTSPRPGDDGSVKLVHASTLEQEVDYVMEEIARAKVPLSEIAILCRANAHAQPFIEALKRRNIPYDFVSEKGLYQKGEIQDLMAVLRVIANPTDDISFYAVMRMPVWKIPMETVVSLIAQAKKTYQPLWSQIKKSDACQLLADTLTDLLEYSRNHTVGETLYRFTETIRLYEQLLSKNSVEAEEQIVNIATFFNRIRDFERGSDYKTVIDFVAYLEMALEAGENPAAKFQIEEREGVFVSTVHGAKGLEFNTVFLPGLTNDRFPARNRQDAIPIPDALVHEILTDADTHVQEERRLFYVACTRAKDGLHLLYSDYYTPSASKSPRKKKRSRFIDEIIDAVALTQIEKTAEGVEQFLKPRAVSVVAVRSDAHPKITQFSYSQLVTFQDCPRQYQYQYLYHIPQPMNANFSFGSSIHNTLQEFYKNVQQVKQASLFTEFEPDMSLERLLAIYEDKWVDKGYESKAHMELRKERGREILTAFYDKFRHDMLRIRFLEKGFKLKMGDYTIS